MIGGPVTAVPTMVMFWTIFKKRVFALYLFVCLAGTILISYAFQFLVFVPGADTGNPLLKGVGSMSGGRSAVIEKTNPHVRIVMDPGGKSIIATYDNDLDGQGGVVFDADRGRFLDSPADRYDNRRYAVNVAEWLEQNNTSSAREHILVYDAARGTGAPAAALNGNLLAELQQKGYKVDLADRVNTPKLSRGLLDRYSQVWLFFGSSGEGETLTPGELDAISGVVDNGKSLLLVAGSPPSGTDGLAVTNRLASHYGVHFIGQAENPGEIRATVVSHLFYRASEVLGMILKQMHKA
jgi:hypothetical protein